MPNATSGLAITSAPVPLGAFARGFAAAIAGAGAMLSPQLARAAEITAYTGATLQYDSNLFRAADDSVTPGVSRDERSLIAMAGAEVALGDEEFGGGLDGRLFHQWFDKNSYLDFLGYSLSGNVAKNGPVVQIALDAKQDRRLSSFSDIRTTQRNLQTLTRLNGDVSVSAFGDWRLMAGGSMTRSSNSAALVESNDFRQIGGRVGIGYYSPLGNILALRFTHLRGKGLNSRLVLIDGVDQLFRQDFKENGGEVLVKYAPSVATAISARLGYVDRRDDSVFDNDLKGIVARITADWSPRETIRIKLDAGRRLETESYIYADAVKVTYGGISGEADVTPDVTAKAGFQYTRQRFSYDIQAFVPLQGRTEHLKVLSAGIEYQPAQRFGLSLEGSRELRDSNAAGFDYDANVVRLTGLIKFGAGAQAGE